MKRKTKLSQIYQAFLPSFATIVTALETKIDDLTLQFVQEALIKSKNERTQMTTSILHQVVLQPCHHSLEEMCRITPGQWEQRDQAY